MSTDIDNVIEEIRSERHRQVDSEGWTYEHDDQHVDGSLADVAAVYAAGRSVFVKEDYVDHSSRLKYVFVSLWPASWDVKWFKPKNRRRDLVRAGALIVAEIERLDRAAAA